MRVEVTTGRAVHRDAEVASLRHRVGAHRTEILALAGVVIAVIVVQGAPLLTQRWLRGDLLYHSGLVAAILRGEFPPGGPYEGLPTYYPPGFHIMVAATMVALHSSFENAIRVLTIAWLPVLPIGTYLLTRHLLGRPGVALLATVLTVFGGGLDPGNDLAWVNSLFLSGHAAAPIYPRDVVFSILPWAALAAVKALEATDRPRRTYVGWAVAAGVLLGGCALVQVQLLLPIPAAIVAVALARVAVRPDRALRTAIVVALIAIVTVAPVIPWILTILGHLNQGGGLSIESSDRLTPLQAGFWDAPRLFGVILPFGLIGAGGVLLLLRGSAPRPAGETETRWRPSARESPLLLVAWAALPFLMAIAYRPDWPLEDALRPQRLFLLAGQALVILAGIGLVTAAEDLRAKWGRRLVAVGLAAALILATLPATVANSLRAFTAFADPVYVHLDLVADRVPDFRSIMPAGGGRSGLLTYEDWSALAWYQTGAWVVGMDPPGYSKLAFDPEVFTGVSQDDRRAALFSAFDGRIASLTQTADRFDMSRIAVAKKGDRWGLIDRSAGIIPSVDPEALGGTWSVLEGNGFDALVLEGGASVTLDGLPSGPLDLELRVQSARDRGPARLRLAAVSPDGSSRLLAVHDVPRAFQLPDWPMVKWSGTLQPGEVLRLEADQRLNVQSVRGYVSAPPVPDGWVVENETPDYVVLARRGS